MSEARDETIRKQQAKGGAGTQSRETFPFRSFGLCPIPWLLPSRRLQPPCRVNALSALSSARSEPPCAFPLCEVTSKALR